MKNLTAVSTSLPSQQSLQNGETGGASEENLAKLFQQHADRTQFMYARGIRLYTEAGNSTTPWVGGWNYTTSSATFINCSGFAINLGTLAAGDLIVVKASIWAKMSGAASTGEIRLAVTDAGGTPIALGKSGISITSTSYAQFTLVGHYTMDIDRAPVVSLQGRGTAGLYYPTIGSPSSMQVTVYRKFP